MTRRITAALTVSFAANAAGCATELGEPPAEVVPQELEVWHPGTTPGSDDTWCFGNHRHLHRGDFNGDGKDDLLCHNSDTGRRRIDFAGTNNLEGFGSVDWDTDRSSGATKNWCSESGASVYVGDYNGDGRDDLLCHVSSGYTNAGWKRIDFASSSGLFFGTNFSSKDYPTAAQSWCTNPGESLYVGDFNGDGKDDLLCHVSSGFAAAGRRRIDFANSAGTFFGTNFNSESYSSAAQHWCTNPGESLYVGDFNGDGKDDLLCHVGRGFPNQGRRRIDHANSSGTFFGTNFNSETYSSAAQAWCKGSGTVLRVGDYNRDGKDDLLCFRMPDGLASIDHANSEGTLFGTNAKSTEDWCDGSSQTLMVGDFNGDQRDDLLCHDSSTGDRRIRFANSEGSFRSICSTQSTQGDGELQPIDIHFVVISDPLDSRVSNRHAATALPASGVPKRGIPTSNSVHLHPLTGNPLYQNTDNSSYFRAEIDVINTNFFDEDGDTVCDGNDCLSFRYAGHTLFEEIDPSSCPDLYKLGNPPSAEWARDCKNCGEGAVKTSAWDRTFAAAVLACSDPKIRKPGALNFYVMDQCNWGLSNATCGRNISNGLVTEQAVAMAYERLLRGSATGDRDKAKGVEQHELGHALGLNHTWDCQTYSNAMEYNSVDEPFCDSAPEADAHPEDTPVCSVPGPAGRHGGFYRAARVFSTPSSASCTSVNTVDQIDKMVSVVRRNQIDWFCQLQ